MENASSESLWITIQSHENIVAVALLCEIRAVLISGSKSISSETIKRAEKENIVILSSHENSYKCACKLFSLLQK
jgi:predicted transcriptional regulator